MNITSKCMSYTAKQTGGFYKKCLSRENIPNYIIGMMPAIVPKNHYLWDNNGLYGDAIGVVSKDKYGIKPYSENRFVGDDSTTQYGWRITSNGGNKSFDITQPYIVVYLWKRIN